MATEDRVVVVSVGMASEAMVPGDGLVVVARSAEGMKRDGGWWGYRDDGESAVVMVRDGDRVVRVDTSRCKGQSRAARAWWQ
jgi:hypothetical protein